MCLPPYAGGPYGSTVSALVSDGTGADGLAFSISQPLAFHTVSNASRVHLCVAVVLPGGPPDPACVISTHARVSCPSGGEKVTVVSSLMSAHFLSVLIVRLIDARYFLD